MSATTNSRTVRRARAGTTEAPWVRYTLITVALLFMLLISFILLLIINGIQAWGRRRYGGAA